MNSCSEAEDSLMMLSESFYKCSYFSVQCIAYIKLILINESLIIKKAYVEGIKDFFDFSDGTAYLDEFFGFFLMILKDIGDVRDRVSEKEENAVAQLNVFSYLFILEPLF